MNITTINSFFIILSAIALIFNLYVTQGWKAFNNRISSFIGQVYFVCRKSLEGLLMLLAIEVILIVSLMLTEHSNNPIMLAIIQFIAILLNAGWQLASVIATLLMS